MKRCSCLRVSRQRNNAPRAYGRSRRSFYDAFVRHPAAQHKACVLPLIRVDLVSPFSATSLYCHRNRVVPHCRCFCVKYTRAAGLSALALFHSRDPTDPVRRQAKGEDLVGASAAGFGKGARRHPPIAETGVPQRTRTESGDALSNAEQAFGKERGIRKASRPCHRRLPGGESGEGILPYSDLGWKCTRGECKRNPGQKCTSQTAALPLRGGRDQWKKVRLYISEPEDGVEDAIRACVTTNCVVAVDSNTSEQRVQDRKGGEMVTRYCAVSAGLNTPPPRCLDCTYGCLSTTLEKKRKKRSDMIKCSQASF